MRGFIERCREDSVRLRSREQNVADEHRSHEEYRCEQGDRRPRTSGSFRSHGPAHPLPGGELLPCRMVRVKSSTTLVPPLGDSYHRILRTPTPLIQDSVQHAPVKVDRSGVSSTVLSRGRTRTPSFRFAIFPPPPKEQSLMPVRPVLDPKIS